jgi:hypothetical protein
MDREFLDRGSGEGKEAQVKRFVMRPGSVRDDLVHRSIGDNVWEPGKTRRNPS